MTMTLRGLLLGTSVLLAAVLPSAQTAAARPSNFGWPLDPRPQVVTAFAPPEHDWLPGHRGVDLAGRNDQTVRAAGDGIVAFAGVVAGKPVVSVEHPNGLRTTYEPVAASVVEGERVRTGDALGVLAGGHSGCDGTCLHWGVRRGREYLDPLALVRTTPVRLKPLGSGL